MKKRLFTAVLLLTALLIQVFPLTASAVSNPIVHLSFESISGNTVVNERNSSQTFSLTGVSQIDGYAGKGVSIGSNGGIFGRSGAISRMLNGHNGITFSAYIKNGSSDSGNLLSVYSKTGTVGIRMTKEGSVISAHGATSASEALISASYDTQRIFSEWTHIAVSLDFTRKMSRFYVDGVHLLTVPMAFANDVYTCSNPITNDKIGGDGLLLDEVRIHPTTIHCSEPMTIFKLDSGVSVKEAYNDVLKNNLVTYFPFDEGEGDTVSSAGGFIKAVGTAQAPLDWTEGVSGSAVKFHAEDKNWINIGNLVPKALNEASGLTVSGWFFLNKVPGSGTQNRAFSLNIIDAGALFHLVFRTTGEISVSARSGISTPLVGLNFIKPTDATQVAKNEFEKWHHVTITTDLKEKYMRLFLDGEEVLPNNATGSNTVSYVNDAFVLPGVLPSATIGGDHAKGLYSKTFNGAIDELKIYNRAITYNEARYIYHENKNGSVMSRDMDNYAVFNTLNLTAMAVGCNEIFEEQRRQRISWENPDICPEMKNGTMFVPAELIAKLPDTSVSVNLSAKTATVNGMLFTEGKKSYTSGGKEDTLSAAPYLLHNTMYLPLRAVGEQLGYAISYHNSGLAVVGDAASVATVTETTGYAEWLHKALTVVPYTKQTADHYATRNEIYMSENPSTIFPSSPAIVKLSDGTLVASHDTIGHGTTIYRSTDDGKTWTKVRKPNADSDDDNIDDTIEEIVYANLFTNTPASTGVESLYLMGVRRGTGEQAAVAIYRSDDGGLTWTTPKDNKTGWIVEDDGTSVLMPAHTAPTPVVKKDGRIYRAFDVSGSGWKNFKVAVMSADENADLLRRDSWTISNTLLLSNYSSSFPQELNCADPGMCEANAVLGPDGKIWVLARFNSAPSVDWAAVLKLQDDNTLAYDRVIRFPGGMSKFVVRYDESIGKYIAVSNPNIQRDYPNQRLCLSMMVSEDLYQWRTVETLLVPNWLENLESMTQKYAFQYPDFVFDGNDIVYVVREANIGAADYHNANCITFYRLENYKHYIPVN